MKDYILFFIKCLNSNFRFFQYSFQKRASILEKHRLFFEAGMAYMKIKNYAKAATCFHTCGAYRHCMKAYEKLGSYSSAIEIAEDYGYYEEGALLCDKIGNTKKAAYFYQFIKPLHAAKLYKQQKLFYLAGQAYMRCHEFQNALDCFLHCPGLEEKERGLKQIEDTAVALYFSKQYDAAFKLFLKLKDYLSALECAKKLQYPELLQSMHTLLALYYHSLGEYSLAAKYIEPYHPNKALLYYYLDKNNTDAIRLLLDQKEYDKAINICEQHHYFALADEITKWCA